MAGRACVAAAPPMVKTDLAFTGGPAKALELGPENALELGPAAGAANALEDGPAANALDDDAGIENALDDAAAAEDAGTLNADKPGIMLCSLAFISSKPAAKSTGASRSLARPPGPRDDTGDEEGAESSSSSSSASTRPRPREAFFALPRPRRP